MRVATEVGEDVLGSAEGLLGVDDPPLLRELGHQAVEGLWVAKVVEAGKDTARVEPLDGIEKLAAKERAEHAHGKQELGLRDPALTVERQSAGGDDRVDVGMKAQVSRPGVKHHGEAEVEPEPRAAELADCLRGSGEQRAEHVFPPKSGEPVQDVRHGEDDMEVTDGQDAFGALFDPCALRGALTLRAMPIATGIVRSLRKSAAVARVEMAAEGRRAARGDRAQHRALVGCQSVEMSIRLAEVADDVRDLERGAHGETVRRAEHGCALRRRAFPFYRQPIERARRLREHRVRDAGVPSGRRQVLVTEKLLDDADIGTRLEQMGREAVA